MLDETVAGKRDVGPVGAGRPQRHGVGGLHDALAGEEAHGALVAHLVQARIDLLAHGVAHHAHKAAHARLPHAPGHGVERGHAIARRLKAAGQALARGHADAHAGEGARARAAQHGLNLVARRAELREQPVDGADELLVGMAAAKMVTAGKDLDAVLSHDAQGAGEHVGGGVDGDEKLGTRGVGGGDVGVAHDGGSRLSIRVAWQNRAGAQGTRRQG